jgi:hypothetical protein
MSRRTPEKCRFCACYSHAWVPTQRWGVVMTDIRDAHLLGAHVWSMLHAGRSFYACSRTFSDKPTLLHQAIFPSSLIDHKNHNGLDCRRDNIREASRKQNSRNRRPSVGKFSTFLGVSYENGKWRARIFVDGKRLQLGHFALEEDAALAYNFAAHEHFGEFARFNR